MWREDEECSGGGAGGSITVATRNEDAMQAEVEARRLEQQDAEVSKVQPLLAAIEVADRCARVARDTPLSSCCNYMLGVCSLPA